ncbi:hypothetical protein LTR37_005718 [Vermiconidia calcicola]|uniref:Uncharacterized protein n=1 Tax=Vermiconidia calcicola TaxID=1690605 RepID=A0ACC3NIY6_9PEZI|nr:hypothetical protein LTR37_005718 [Vermiconidia calcicola]
MAPNPGMLPPGFARRNLRRWLRQLHFTRDKIALFNLPALEIDTDVNGLFVIRGVTISLSSLSLVAHGIELGLMLADDIELAIYVDEVTVSLFRRIEIGEVYANVKGGKVEMSFAELDDPTDTAADDDSVFIETPLLRAATAGSKGFQDRPKLRESLTGVSYIKDSSAKAIFDAVRKLSPDDTKAEQQYHDILTEIRTTSAVYQSRARVRQKIKAGNNDISPEDEKDMRAAMCAELHEILSIPHPPTRSVRVTTLQHLSPPYVRRFLHRLPFLLRLLIAPLSYFHNITISGIIAGGSGRWLSELLLQKVFKHYTDSSAEIRRLERKISVWLAKANFCLQLTNIDGNAQVPLNTEYDIFTYLKFRDMMAYRTVPEDGTIIQVARLGGADATFTIPSYLLPHHEHIVPPRPTKEDEERLAEAVEDADGKPQTVQAAQVLEKAQKDETEIKLSVHGSLPACFDQSLLNFIAALVKATKIIESFNEIEEEEAELQSGGELSGGEDMAPLSPTTTLSPDSETSSVRSFSADPPVRGDTGFKTFTANIRQNLKDKTTSQSIKNLAKDLNKSTKDGMKKAIGGLVNDRWIAKVVGKVAAKLETAQGDLGYSGAIPIPLEPYRTGAEELPSKLLP